MRTRVATTAALWIGHPQNQPINCHAAMTTNHTNETRRTQLKPTPDPMQTTRRMRSNIENETHDNGALIVMSEKQKWGATRSARTITHNSRKVKRSPHTNQAQSTM